MKKYDFISVGSFNDIKNNLFMIKAFEKIISEGYDVNYVVLGDGGRYQAGTNSSQTVLIDVMCYVPGSRFTDLDGYASLIKGSINELFPLVIPTGNETQAFYDESIKGWMKSVEYRYTVRNRFLRG